MKKDLAPVSRIREVLDYDPATGIFTWKVSSRNGWVGKAAGGISSEGYITFTIDGRNYKSARVAWAMVHGEWPPENTLMDHIDGCRTNNRMVNLRLASPRENKLNSKTRSDSKSGAKGVRCRRGRWQARIFLDGRDVSLGYFKTKEEATEAYAAAARRQFGDFARMA